MSSMSNYLEQKLLEHTLLNSTFSAAATIWCCLATSITSDGNMAAVTEVTTNTGYARQAVGRGWSVPTSGPDWSVVNSGAINFPTATTPWGTVAHVFLADSASIGQGNVYYHGTLDNSRDVQTDDVFEFADSALSIKMS